MKSASASTAANSLLHSLRRSAICPVVICLSLTMGCSKRAAPLNEPLSSSASEDVSHLLVAPESSTVKFDTDAPCDYLPDPNIDWTVTIRFDSSVAVDRASVNTLLDVAWLESHGRPVVYGYSPDSGHWTFVKSPDAPESFTNLKIAWSLWNAIDEKPKGISPENLDQFKSATEKQLSQLGEFSTETERSSTDALAYVATLPKIVADCNRDIILVLATNGNPYSGREVWDVMLCLGLEYGDGDLFHWTNNSNSGADTFFTVETSTAPGYFAPKRMAVGEGDVADLIFGFSIPRSADPMKVFESMANAVEYAQKRLGGEILLPSGERFNRKVERANVADIVRKMRDAGFQPGEHATLRVF